MEIRKDLESVAPYISRLISVGEEFRAFDKDWSHLKNQEDFRFVSRVPYEKRHKVEAVYADGRDMAIYMYDALLSINSDFSRYPTLTAIVEAFKNTWVYGSYDPEVPNVASDVCVEHDVDLWSVKQMVALFKKQEQLLAAVRVTLQMLQNSDLYKMENGIPVMKQEANIQVSGNSGSSININSSGATASVTVNYNEPTIFADMISAIKSNDLDNETEKVLIDNVQALAASHQSGGFKEAYKDFMQNVSAHITVFSPFISGLAALL
ncbi:hypothetical protein [Celerinatantimonas diazotrophica]|uniref:Uncharacterized protein n=1 Tax=Celerinatantimonas diazotrophica TaxID=412034 RepID=A0A4R1K400_9GAMM|nr:hypothetical protein [Celerinatantimonas diazotrophica]TCK58822.1 hypothetical protein EV690_0971 [Celerinatantimonas diazotrophica]CAG9297454.1 hypothetical protein CEDIAZO_02635 [Celerinatantimonas diazotrophica]